MGVGKLAGMEMNAISTGNVWERGRFDAADGPGKILFGRMYEDAAIELDAFARGGRILCIASAGCTAMALAPHYEVVAVDINPVQLRYAERRFAGLQDKGQSILECGHGFHLRMKHWQGVCVVFGRRVQCGRHAANGRQGEERCGFHILMRL